jgi:hypothetical protein
MTFQATLRGLAAACCIFATIPAPADEPGRRYFSVNASRVPEADFRGLPPGNDVRTSDNQVAAAFARISHESLRVDFGFDYQYTRYKYNELDSRNRDLHRVQFPVWLSAPVQNWQLRGHVAPGIFTSSNVLGDFFNRGSSDDLYVSGRFEAERTGSSMPWILGIAHDRSFGRSSTYPVIGIRLSPDDSLDVRLAWPDPALRYRPSDRQMLTFEVFPAGNQWHVRTDDFSRDFDYRIEAWRSQVTWSFSVFDSTMIDLSLGYEFERSHHLDDDPGARVDAAADDQWLFAIGFRFGDGPLPLTHGAHLNR